MKPPSRPPQRPTIDTSLDRNTLYSIDLGPGRGRCDVPVRRADPPLPDDEVGAYLRRLVRCMTRALAPTLTRAGILLVTPEVKVYRTRIATPCGTLRPTSAPAYYCSGDGIIYFPAASDDADEAYTYARLGYLALIAHEYGHHLQFASGMFADYTEHYYRASIGDRDAISRRLELQADCFAGVFLGYVGPSVGLSATDRDELNSWHTFTGDEDPPADRAPDHGTSKAQIRWLDRGLDSADYGRCNTWTADPVTVR